MPAPLFDLLRGARTTALRTLGPFDFVARALSGRRHLPPLWLRRHAGPVSKFETSANETAALIHQMALLRPGDRVLDIGCGPGAMALELARRLGPQGRYVGFDVHQSSIRWCRRRFAGDLRLRFEVADVSTPYSPRSGGRPEAIRFPAEEGSVDLAIAKSIFTHLLEAEAARYLGEIRRVLAPGRAAFVTAFLFEKTGATPLFPRPDGLAAVRWRSRARPRAAVAYDRLRFQAMIEEAGLRLRGMCAGFWPGDTAARRGQDILILEGI